MSKKTFGFTIALTWLISSIGQAGELSQDQLDEVVSFAQAQDYYNCNDFKDAYLHPSMNHVYQVEAQSPFQNLRLAEEIQESMLLLLLRFLKWM